MKPSPGGAAEASRITFLTWRDEGHPDGGGSERYVREIATRLASRGHAVTILCAAYPGAAAEELVGGVRFLRRGGRRSVYGAGLRYLLSRDGRAQDVVVDVINGLPFAARLVRRSGVLVLVHHLHREQWHMIYPGLRGRIGWFVESRLAPALYRNTRHVTVSEATRADLVAVGVRPGLVSVVRNGVSAPANPDPPDRSPDPRLCVLARLVPHKQIEDAIHVVARLAGELPQLHLDIIGRGWWSERLREAVVQCGVQERVSFHGYLPDVSRDRLLAQAWLMLAPSVKEGWGIAITEAAAVGTPTIAYAGAGGVREAIVDGVTGLLAADLDDLVDLTRRLLQDEARRRELSLAATAYARSFSWETTAEQFERVCEQVRRSAAAVLDDSLPGRVAARRRVLCGHHGDHRDDRERRSDERSADGGDDSGHGCSSSGC